MEDRWKDERPGRMRGGRQFLRQPRPRQREQGDGGANNCQTTSLYHYCAMYWLKMRRRSATSRFSVEAKTRF